MLHANDQSSSSSAGAPVSRQPRPNPVSIFSRDRIPYTAVPAGSRRVRTAKGRPRQITEVLTCAHAGARGDEGEDRDRRQRDGDSAQREPRQGEGARKGEGLNSATHNVQHARRIAAKARHSSLREKVVWSLRRCGAVPCGRLGVGHSAALRRSEGSHCGHCGL